MIADKPLTDSDVTRYLGPQGNPLKYSEVKKYTFEQLLPAPDSFKVLLLEDKRNSGHWTCLLRKGDGAEYFNSFGKKYDDDLDPVPKMVKKILGETPNTIETMLGGRPCAWNKTKLQADDSQTCGRYVVSRVQNREKSNPAFVKWLKGQKTTTYDDLIRQLVK
jgi:hypothetical protein